MTMRGGEGGGGVVGIEVESGYAYGPYRTRKS